MQYYTAGVYDAKGEWIDAQMQRCRCGLVPLGENCAYCGSNRAGFTGEESPTKRTRAQMREDAAIRLEESRRLKVQEVEEQLRVAGVAGTSPATPRPQKPKQKRTRRSSAEVQAVRARREAERAQRALLTQPAWLTEEDPDMEAFMQQYRESEPI